MIVMVAWYWQPNLTARYEQSARPRTTVRDPKSKVTVFVPHYAMSRGTLVAVAADEIVICKHSVLGAIDPQFGDSPAASLLKVVEQKPVAEIDDQTLIRADIGEGDR
jgi:ClpP class serine protease